MTNFSAISNSLTLLKTLIKDEYYSETISDNVLSLCKVAIEKEVSLVGKSLSRFKLKEILDVELTREEIVQGIEKEGYICPEYGFKISDFLVSMKEDAFSPIITEARITNLKKIYASVILPIVFTYSEASDINEKNCRLVINQGLIHPNAAINKGESTGKDIATSLFIDGKAVSISITGISDSQLIQDIRSGKFDIEYGMVYLYKGVTLTLPLNLNGEMITNLYLNQVQASTNITYEIDNKKVM